MREGGGLGEVGLSATTLREREGETRPQFAKASADEDGRSPSQPVEKVDIQAVEKAPDARNRRHG